MSGNVTDNKNASIKTKYYTMENLCDLKTQVEQNLEGADVGQFMQNLYERKLFTDVTFLPNKGTDSSISAHRVILAAKCPYFAQLLYGDKNTNGHDMKMSIRISNMSFDAFRNIINYFYTGEINFTNVTMAMETFKGAKQFEIQSLISKCELYFEQLELTEENVCSVLQDSKDIVNLRSRSLRYIQENTQKVIGSKDFKRSLSSTVETIIGLESLTLDSEMQLLTAVVCWKNAQPHNLNSKIIEPLLSCIRFLTLTDKEFGNFIKTCPDLLDSKDALQIMMFINDKENGDTELLPAWCNKNTAQRCSQFKSDESEEFKTLSTEKIVVPLIPATEEYQEDDKLVSYLRIQCINGYHRIDAIKFSFQHIPSVENVPNLIILRISLYPGRFRYQKNIAVCSAKQTIPLKNGIWISKGGIMQIEAEIKGVRDMKFFQVDVNESIKSSNYFRSSVNSTPQGKLFFIREVQYSSQVCRSKNSGKFRKNLNPW